MFKHKNRIFTFVFIIFIFIILFQFFNDDNSELQSVFNIDKRYDQYILEYVNGLTLEEYKSIFEFIPESEYKIINYEIFNNYPDKVINDMKSINLYSNNYIDALNEYLKKTKNILDNYNISSEIDKINNNNFVIEKIKILSTYEVYNQLTG